MLTAGKKQEIEEVFSFYDFNHDGKIYITDLGIVLRCLGVTMSDKALDMLCMRYKRAGKAVIDIEELTKLVTEKLKVQRTEAQLAKNFDAFVTYTQKDGDHGKLVCSCGCPRPRASLRLAWRPILLSLLADVGYS